MTRLTPHTDQLHAACLAEITLSAKGLFFADAMATIPQFAGTLYPYQTTSESIQSLLRMNTVDHSVIEKRARDDPTVRSVEYLQTVNGYHLYDLTTTFGTASPFQTVGSDRFTILSASAQAGTWSVLLGASSVTVIEDCRHTATINGVSWETERVYCSPLQHPLHVLTPVQRETMETAFALGYFEIPRMISMQELADELGVTPNAVSERLRRAEARLLSALLSDDVSTPAPES